MLRIVSDVEADGFLEDVTTIHCIVAKDIDSGYSYFFHEGKTAAHLWHGTIEQGIDYIFSAHLLIGHNFLGYDLPVIWKLYQRQYTGQVLDTLVMSRTLFPGRKLPKGCPTSTLNPVTKKKDKVTPHSLDAWGYRVGRGKPKHYDWGTFSEAMLHRCSEDVEITHLTYLALLAEIDPASNYEYPTYESLPNYVRVEQRVSEIMERQQAVGWLVDQDKLHENVAILKNLLDTLERRLDPILPFLAKPKESKFGKKDKKAAYLNRALGINLTDESAIYWPHRKFVTKPYMASGQWNKSVAAWWSEYTKDTAPFEITGPFCRVEFSKVSLSSDAEVKDFLLTQGWVPDEWNYSKITHKITSPKITESSLETVRGKTGKLVSAHLKAQNRYSTMKGWVRDMGADGRLHGIVNPQFCPTVRMTHKILVNVPSVEKRSFFAKKMRECFIAPPGYVLVSADVKSCQARMLAWYMGDPDFTYAVIHGKKSDGTDIHSLNMHKAGLPTRGHAKNFFYGFIFGAGPAKVGRLINGDKRAGQRIIDRYLAGLPKLKDLRTGLERKWKANGGWLTGLDGRKIYIANKKDLLVYMLQSAEAMIMKIAICLVNHWARAEGLDFEQVCVMHDEYTFQVRTDHAERMKYLSEQAIWQAGLMLGLPEQFAEGEAMIGHNWKEIH